MGYFDGPGNQRRPPGPADAIARIFFYIVLIAVAILFVVLYVRGLPEHPDGGESRIRTIPHYLSASKEPKQTFRIPS